MSVPAEAITRSRQMQRDLLHASGTSTNPHREHQSGTLAHALAQPDNTGRQLHGFAARLAAEKASPVITSDAPTVALTSETSGVTYGKGIVITRSGRDTSQMSATVINYAENPTNAPVSRDGSDAKARERFVENWKNGNPCVGCGGGACEACRQGNKTSSPRNSLGEPGMSHSPAAPSTRERPDNFIALDITRQPQTQRAEVWRTPVAKPEIQVLMKQDKPVPRFFQRDIPPSSHAVSDTLRAKRSTASIENPSQKSSSLREQADSDRELPTAPSEETVHQTPSESNIAIRTFTAERAAEITPNNFRHTHEARMEEKADVSPNPQRDNNIQITTSLSSPELTVARQDMTTTPRLDLLPLPNSSTLQTVSETISISPYTAEIITLPISQTGTVSLSEFSVTNTVDQPVLPREPFIPPRVADTDNLDDKLSAIAVPAVTTQSDQAPEIAPQLETLSVGKDMRRKVIELLPTRESPKISIIFVSKDNKATNDTLPTQMPDKPEAQPSIDQSFLPQNIFTRLATEVRVTNKKKNVRKSKNIVIQRAEPQPLPASNKTELPFTIPVKTKQLVVDNPNQLPNQDSVKLKQRLRIPTVATKLTHETSINNPQDLLTSSLSVTPEITLPDATKKRKKKLQRLQKVVKRHQDTPNTPTPEKNIFQTTKEKQVKPKEETVRFHEEKELRNTLYQYTQTNTTLFRIDLFILQALLYIITQQVVLTQLQDTDYFPQFAWHN